jgi:hypothetical protein
VGAFEVGTRDWMARTGGRLSGREQARFLMLGMRSQMAQMPERVAAALGLRRARLASIDLDDLRLPDSPAAREAGELCAELEPHLENHSRRSYLWSAILARHDGLTIDEELVYVAALLHDHGVPRAIESRDSRCFTVTSAATAVELAERHGWDRARAEAAAEGITLHLNPYVPPEQGVESHVLNAGIALDVGGLRHWQVDRATKDAVVARHPREGFKRRFPAELREHARHAPGCRAHVLMRRAGFGAMIRTAPFRD